jgi:S-DNA-T family DNA segregation ATPase FtsK/SpoIIIE
VDVEDADPLFDEAVQIVAETRRASISGVQRRLKIGYNRAARMVEEMERIGIVTPPDTKGNRDVLAPPPPEP